ncbi:diguanylate cyclase [Stenotrophomonas sp. JAG2]|uniref:GGDEF domain-containing protein n=1 Tax=Stenotrophomonas sp. JAG2 TaxID=3229243 RepID=UPI0034E2DE33
MVVWLSVLYLLCHGIALVLLPAHALPVSYAFLIGAPVLAAMACVWRGRRSASIVGWYAMALGMGLWAAGMALNMYQEVGRGNADATPGLSMLLYVLYGVPLTFAMAHPRHEPWYLSLIDALLALLLGYLFFVYTFSFATLNDAGEEGIEHLRLMFDVENIFIAGFALLRWRASEDASRRVFFRTLCVFAWVYLGVAAYINHVDTEGSYGGRVDLLIDVPFLLLAVMALRPSRRGDVRVPRTLVMAVRAGSPLILAVSLMVVSALMVRDHPYLAVAGFVLATLGSGLRSVLMQMHSFARQDQLDALSRIDSLTGLANRRQFDQSLRDAWERARRSGQGIALLMVDIDCFKDFNDRYGHPAGDQCLRLVAATLAGCAVRSTDLVARYGGEEFAVVVASSPLDGAPALAERMRHAVEQLQLPSAESGRPVTISIGVGTVRLVLDADPAELLAAADTALYSAKRGGRNRVEADGEPG